MSARDRQVGGSHYRLMGMQPFDFTVPNGYDGISHTLLKYVSRYPRKEGLEDVTKMIHCIDLLVEAMRDGRVKRNYEDPVYTDPLQPSIGQYITANRKHFSAAQAAVLVLLDEAVRAYAKDGWSERIHKHLMDARLSTLDISDEAIEAPKAPEYGIQTKLASDKSKARPSNRK